MFRRTDKKQYILNITVFPDELWPNLDAWMCNETEMNVGERNFFFQQTKKLS